MPVTRRALYLRGTTTIPSTYWRGSRSAQSLPEDAILTEDGLPILTEIGEYIEIES